MSIGRPHTRPAVSEAEVERRMNFADGALGAPGHEVTDPELRAISRRVAADEITADEAAELVKTHLLGTR